MDVVCEVFCMHLLGAIARLLKTNIGFIKSVRPPRTNRPQLGGHSSLSIFEVSLKFRLENLS